MASYGWRWTDSKKPRTFWMPSSPRRSFHAGIPLSTRPTVIVAYAFKLLLQEMMSLNIAPRLKLRDKV